MNLKRVFLHCAGFTVVVVFGSAIWQENQAPIVKINSPKPGASIAWNTRLQYAISVSDREDGESKYHEIAGNEVLLEVRYVSDTTTAVAFAQRLVQKDHAGFAAFKKSNCLNCHQFEGKLIGPSFEEIGQRYSTSTDDIALMAQRVREGSSGIWGDVVMPTHPELTVEETKNMMEWIMIMATDQNVSCYFGTEGSFVLQPPSGADGKGVFVLTASYTDHGRGAAGHGLKAVDVITIRGK